MYAKWTIFPFYTCARPSEYNLISTPAYFRCLLIALSEYRCSSYRRNKTRKKSNELIKRAYDLARCAPNL